MQPFDIIGPGPKGYNKVYNKPVRTLYHAENSNFDECERCHYITSNKGVIKSVNLRNVVYSLCPKCRSKIRTVINKFMEGKDLNFYER